MNMMAVVARVRSLCLLVVAVVLGLGSIAAAPQSVGAAMIDTAQSGGAFGTPFSLTCSDGKVLIGITGTYGSYVDSIRGICARFDQIGVASAIQETASRGGTGAKAYHWRCPSGNAVVGLRGKSGLWVDQVGLICAEIKPDGKVDSATKTDHPFVAGGSSGTSFRLECPNSLPARALKGASGQFIDRIGLGCEQGAISSVRPSDTSRPDMRVAIKNLPFNAKEDKSVTYRVELWNVGHVTAPQGIELDLGTTYSSFGLATISPTSGFSGQGTCVTNLPVGEVFARCTAGQATAPNTFSMSISVTFTPDLPQNGASFTGSADPRGRLAEANESNNSHSASMSVLR